MHTHAQGGFTVPPLRKSHQHTPQLQLGKVTRMPFLQKDILFTVESLTLHKMPTDYSHSPFTFFLPYFNIIYH